MAITSVTDIATALALAQRMRFVKTLTAAKAAGSYQSGWMATGIPTAGVASPAYNAGAGYTCSRTTVGALGQVNGAVQNWIARLQATGTQACTLFIADRLWSCSGMGFAAATYTVTTPGELPARITDAGLGCELWVENFVACGAATVSLTCNYKNAADGAEVGVINPVVTSPVTGQMQPVPLGGTTGVRSLVSCVNSNTWTSGTWGMTILKVHAQIEIPTIGAGASLDWTKILAPIPDDACLMFFIMANVTTAMTLGGTAWIIDK